MSSLEKAIMIATKAHMGQKDKLGQAYILHPLAVMLGVETEDERIVAVLHDIIEDTNITLDDLSAEGFSSQVLEAINILTKREDGDYLEYLNKVKQNRLALRVKLSDINHNMNPDRLKKLEPELANRLYKKYNMALNQLKNN